MPYVITTRNDSCGHNNESITDAGLVRCDDCGLTFTDRYTGRTAVATLEEANARVYEAVAAATGGPEDDALRRRIGRVDESGGTIGPLPDGTVIEVRPITYADLLTQVGPAEDLGAHAPARILAAFNAA